MLKVPCCWAVHYIDQDIIKSYNHSRSFMMHEREHVALNLGHTKLMEDLQISRDPSARWIRRLRKCRPNSEMVNRWWPFSYRNQTISRNDGGWSGLYDLEVLAGDSLEHFSTNLDHSTCPRRDFVDLFVVPNPGCWTQKDTYLTSWLGRHGREPFRINLPYILRIFS